MFDVYTGYWCKLHVAVVGRRGGGWGQQAGSIKVLISIWKEAIVKHASVLFAEHVASFLSVLKVGWSVQYVGTCQRFAIFVET